MQIGVVGLGLIGGSIFKRLLKEGYKVVAVSSSQAKNGIEHVFDDWNVLKNCDVIFVCSPMNKLVSQLKKLESYVAENTIVTDVGSLKSFLLQDEYKYNFIPSHPMAGTEFSGYENSYETLFEGAKWVVTPKDGIVPEILSNLISVMGAKLIKMSPDEHDEAVALISHMPLVLSQALFMTADDNILAKQLASSGFRDMTRLALSSEEMACDMVNLNSENIQKALLKLYANIGNLIKENYPTQINKIKQKRKQMYKDGVNVFEIPQ